MEFASDNHIRSLLQLHNQIVGYDSDCVTKKYQVLIEEEDCGNQRPIHPSKRKVK